MAGELDFGTAQEGELDQVADMHRHCLPTSVLSLLGGAFLRRFYHYCASSALETVTVARLDGWVVAAALVSTEPASLNTRLLFSSNLVWAVIRHFHIKGVRRAVFGRGAQTNAKPEMVALFTDQAVRGQGIGAALVERVLRDQQASGALGCFVRTFADADNPAHRFYVREGFTPVGTFRDHGETFALLKKDLS